MRNLRVLLIVFVALLLPLRAVASVSIGLCAAAQGQAVGHDRHDLSHDGVHEHDAAHHDSADAGGVADHGCSNCAEHCAGVSFVPSPEPKRIAAVPSTDRIIFAARRLPGIVPARFDRPPLVS
jgi:hypothetical protein